MITMFGILKKKLREYREMRAKKISYEWWRVAPNLDQLSYYKKE